MVPFGRPRGERADATRNRARLLQVVREMITEMGVENVTMDGLAERAGLGKGTVFRRFGTRAGIFAALLDDAERTLQESVLDGPPPLGPGADPVRRLIAYGRARIAFLHDHHEIARAAMARDHPVPAGGDRMSPLHIGMLLEHARREGRLDIADLDSLTVQLTAALEGPFLLYLATSTPLPEQPANEPTLSLADSWQTLVERVCVTTGS